MAVLLQIGLLNAVLTAILAVVVLAVTRFWRNPHLAHVLWIVVLLKMATPPLVRVPISFGYEWKGQEIVSAAPKELSTSKRVLSPGTRQTGNTTADLFEASAGFKELSLEPTVGYETSPNISVAERTKYLWPFYLGMIWLGGSLLYALIASLRTVRFHCRLKETDVACKSLQQIGETVAKELGLKRCPELRVTDGQLSPMVWPVGRPPTVVLPRGLVAQLEKEQLRTIVAHEYGHIVRRDHWVRWLEVVCTVLYWWNPCLWLARREIRISEEECCDALVVDNYPGSSQIFGEALLTVSDFLLDIPCGDPVLVSEIRSAGLLKKRIEIMLKNRTPRPLSRMVKVVILVLALVILPLSAQESQTAQSNTEVTSSANISNRVFSKGNKQPTRSQKVESFDGSEDEAGKVFQIAMESIKNNYDNLRTVIVTYEQLTVTPSIERRETITRKTKGGGTFSSTVGPVFVRRQDITLEGDNMRAETYSRVGDDWNHTETRVRQGDRWIQFRPASNWVQRKSTGQLGGFLAIDPRDFGGLSQRIGLLEQMRRSKAISISQANGISKIVAEIVDAPKYGYGQGQKFTYAFDAKRNYLPTQVIRHHDDGNINVLTELTYDEVETGKSWFVRERTIKYFSKEMAAKSPDSNSWHQLIVSKAVGPIRINKELDNAFQLELPR